MKLFLVRALGSAVVLGAAYNEVGIVRAADEEAARRVFRSDLELDYYDHLDVSEVETEGAPAVICFERGG